MDFDVKQQVMAVLEKTEMAEKRPAKMDNHDFLKYFLLFGLD